MTPDRARKATDKKLKEMEKHLTAEYKTAKKEIKQKWNDFFSGAKIKSDMLYDNYMTALKTGDKELIETATKIYGDYLKEYTLQNQYYSDMTNNISRRLYEVNESAVAYVNGEMPNIYASNYNQFFYDVENIKAISFDMVDESTVKAIATTNNSFLPKKTVNIAKDMQWNKKMMNSQLLQGILQGESIDKIANRLASVTDMNKESAIRNARTMTTSAENKGRLDSYEKAQEDGIVLKKVWLATFDDRTRAWHADMDGQTKDIDEPFTNSYGELMHPGDSKGSPANVYNCRCSMTTKIIGFRKADGKIQRIKY